MVENEKSSTLRLAGDVAGVHMAQLCKQAEGFVGSDIERVVVDLRNVGLMDSNAIGGLAYMHYLLEKDGKQLTLLGPPAHIRRVLKATGFDNVLRVVEE